MTTQLPLPPKAPLVERDKWGRWTNKDEYFVQLDEYLKWLDTMEVALRRPE